MGKYDQLDTSMVDRLKTESNSRVEIPNWKPVLSGDL